MGSRSRALLLMAVGASYTCRIAISEPIRAAQLVVPESQLRSSAALWRLFPTVRLTISVSAAAPDCRGFT